MSIGEYLKNVRIKRNITLEKISKELNISYYYLTEIEKDNFSKTPGGVYTVGFIRAYSKYLGLDSSELIKEYKAQISSSEIIKPIEIPQPVHSYYSPYKIASFFTVILVSLVFYKLFISEYNSQSQYALIPDLPENFEIKIEENDVKIAQVVVFQLV